MSSKKKRFKTQENIELEKLPVVEVSPDLIKEKNSMLYIYSSFVVFIFLLVIVPDTKFDDTWNRATSDFQEALKLTDKAKQFEILNNSKNVMIDLIREHPYHARLYTMLGYMYLATGNFDSCIANQAMAIKLGSGGLVNQIEFQAADMIVNATVNKAQNLMRLKDTVRCLENFRHSLSIIPTNQMLLKITGGFFSDFGKPDSSLKYLQESFKYNPNDPEVLYLLGYSYYLKNMTDSAKFYLSKAISINSNYVQAKNLFNQINNK